MYGVCMEKSALINLPLNLVQTNFTTWTYGESAYELNKKYLLGKIISLNNVNNSSIISIFPKIPIKFINKK